MDLTTVNQQISTNDC